MKHNIKELASKIVTKNFHMMLEEIEILPITIFSTDSIPKF